MYVKFVVDKLATAIMMKGFLKEFSTKSVDIEMVVEDGDSKFNIMTWVEEISDVERLMKMLEDM